MSNSQQLIMHYTVPPSFDDLQVMAQEVLENLPEELMEHCEDVAVVVEDLPDEAAQQELELEDPFDLLVSFKSGKEISPGVEKKSANDDDVMVLYRRGILDLWCEEGEELPVLIRHLIIEELGRNFEFSDDDIDEMTERHYQGML